MDEYNTRASIVEPAQKPVIKKSRNLARTLLGLLLLLSLLANAWLWFVWQDSQNEQTNLRSEINSAQTTNATLRERLGRKMAKLQLRQHGLLTMKRTLWQRQRPIILPY